MKAENSYPVIGETMTSAVLKICLWKNIWRFLKSENRGQVLDNTNHEQNIAEHSMLHDLDIREYLAEWQRTGVVASSGKLCCWRNHIHPARLSRPTRSRTSSVCRDTWKVKQCTPIRSSRNARAASPRSRGPSHPESWSQEIIIKRTA